MFTSLVLATAAALAPAPLAKIAIDKGIERHDVGDARSGRGRVPDLGGRLWAGHLRADVPGRVGRSAGLAGPASEVVRASAVAVDRVLLAQSRRRCHLADDQRRRGARPARRGRPGDPDPVEPDADRRGRDPARARLPSRAADVHRAAAAGARRTGVPDRLCRRLPADAGEDRDDHGLPAGDAVGDQGRARVRSGAPAHPPLPRAQRREPGRQHDHRHAERRLLPRRRAPVGAGDGGDPRDRRDRGDQRPHLDRCGVRVHRGAEQLLRPDPAALSAVHDLPVGDGGARQDLRPARRTARARRRSRRGAAAADPRRAALRPCLVQVRLGR